MIFPSTACTQPPQSWGRRHRGLAASELLRMGLSSPASPQQRDYLCLMTSQSRQPLANLTRTVGRTTSNSHNSISFNTSITKPHRQISSETSPKCLSSSFVQAMTLQLRFTNPAREKMEQERTALGVHLGRGPTARRSSANCSQRLQKYQQKCTASLMQV